MRRKRILIRGFTLVELLVVLGIITVMISILLPVLGRVGELSRRTACLSNLHQLGVAAISYAADHDGYFPVRPANAPWPPQVMYWGSGDGRNMWIGYVPVYTVTNSSPYFYCPSNDHDPTLVNSYDQGYSGANTSDPPLIPGFYIIGYAYFGAYPGAYDPQVFNWKGSVRPALRVRDKPITPIFGDVTESYLYTNGEPWFYAAHTTYGGVQWLPVGSPIHPEGMNCALSDGSARWYSIHEDPNTLLVTPDSEVETIFNNETNPGFYWGKPQL